MKHDRVIHERVRHDRDWLRVFEFTMLVIFFAGSLLWVGILFTSAAPIPKSNLPQNLPQIEVEAYAHAMPNQGWAPLKVYFSAYGSRALGDEIVRYQWDLDGNGLLETDTTAEGGYASYVYSKPRDLTITLQVTTAQGQTATATTALHIRHPASSSVDYWTVFDDSRVRKVEVQITQADWQAMWADPEAKIQVQADAVIFGERLKQVGFRMRGQFSLRESGLKKPFKIDTDAYVEGQEFHNLKQLIFTNNIGDPSMLQEKLAYEMMHFAGVPASQVCFVELWIDLVDDDQGPFYWGIYTMIERVDRKFLANRFGPESRDGNLYKASHAQRGPMDLIYYGSDIEDYPTQNGQYAYGKTNNEEDPDYSDILNLIYVIDGVDYGTPDDFSQAVEQVINIDGFLRYMAVVNTLANWDSYPYTGNNFYLFNNAVSGKFEWIPWDLTWGGNPEHLLFELEGHGLVERAPLYDRTFEVEQYRIQYAAYVDLLRRYWFNETHVARIAQGYYELIAPYVTKETGDKMYYEEQPWFPVEAFLDSWKRLVDFTRQREQFITQSLLEEMRGGQ